MGNAKAIITMGIRIADEIFLDNPSKVMATRHPINISGLNGFPVKLLKLATLSETSEIIINAPLHINQPVDASKPAITENGTKRTKLANSNLATK